MRMMHASKGFRELSSQEAVFVSGGTGNSGGQITVTAPSISWGGISLGISGAPGGLGSIAPGLSGGWQGVAGDMDGDGVPDNEDANPYDPKIGGTIQVNGPARLATSFSQLGFFEQVSWMVAYLYSGSELYADLVNHTNITHENPDDPYISKSEALRRYGEAAKEALDRAVEPLGRLR